jgi:diguanylate cyclase (GGDEF)-like protein
MAMEAARDVNGIKRLSRDTLEQIVVLSSEAFLLADAQRPDLPVVFVSPAYAELTGCSGEELNGQPLPLLDGGGADDEELVRLRSALARAEACRATVTCPQKQGLPSPMLVIAEPLYNADGALKYYLLVQRPLGVGGDTSPPVQASAAGVATLSSEPARTRAKPALVDRTDPATGLLRFSHFQETLSRDLSFSQREQLQVTLLLFSIVEFDVYRKTFGSKAAESCQRMIGAQIARTLRRAGDLCARYDDNTLVAAVVGQGPEEVRHLADRIAENVRRLALHNPRARFGRYITIRHTVIGCRPEDDNPAALIPGIADHLREQSVLPAEVLP